MLLIRLRLKQTSLLTSKPLSYCLVANETAVSIDRVTFGESLINCAQVQVDSIVQVERHCPIFL